MSGLLTAMTQSSLTRLEAARAKESEKDLWTRVSDMPPPPPLKLCPEGFDIIAECKLASPSAGDLSAHTTDVENRVRSYAHGGACAVSVLTEPTRFGGNLGHLAQAAAALAPLNVPAMRKDFLVDPYQVMEARLAGAGGVLVILRMLSLEQSAALIECATKLGLFVLLEVFDEADIAQAEQLLRMHAAAATRAQAPLLVGVNCRDLVTLQVVPGRLEQMVTLLPRGVPHVAESGVTSATDAGRLSAAGYDLALVGGALMRAVDALQLVRAMLAAGRTA